jgi:hypothetical protein
LKNGEKLGKKGEEKGGKKGNCEQLPFSGHDSRIPA